MIDALFLVTAIQKQRGSENMADRHHCFKSGNIPKTEGGQTHLNLETV